MEAVTWSLYNPRTGQKIKDYTYSKWSAVDQALHELERGSENWRKKSWRERQEKLKAFINAFGQRRELMAKVIHEEMGKSLELATAEIKKCVDSAEHLCAADLSFLNDQRIENSTYRHARVLTEPLGVVLAIMPWNFPFWQAFRMMIPALLSGNVILLKHSEVSPTAGDLLAACFAEVGLGDLFKHALFSHDLTEKVIGDSRVKATSITGSVRAGEIIANLSARYFKKCVLELGGSDAYVILDDADIMEACRSIAVSRLQNTGQVCVAAKRVLVPRGHVEEFKRSVATAFDEIVVQKKMELVGPLAHARFLKPYLEQLIQIKSRAETIYEKDFSKLNTNEHTAFTQVGIYLFDKNEIMLKDMEVFGPGLVAILYDSVEEAIQIANSTDFGLAAAVYGQNPQQSLSVASRLVAGQVTINDYVRTDVDLPFGGTKKSGLGREIGRQGFLEFTQTKVIAANI